MAPASQDCVMMAITGSQDVAFMAMPYCREEQEAMPDNTHDLKLPGQHLLDPSHVPLLLPVSKYSLKSSGIPLHESHWIREDVSNKIVNYVPWIEVGKVIE